MVTPKKSFRAEQIVTLPRQIAVSMAQKNLTPVATDNFYYITGHNLVVHGGLTLR